MLDTHCGNHMPGQDLQREEETFFDTYFPSGVKQQESYKTDIDDRSSKQQRRELEQSKGGHGVDNGGKGRGDSLRSAPRKDRRERDRGRASRDSRVRDDRDTDQREIEEMRASISSLQRLVLRHEDSISLIQADYSFVAFLKTSTASSVVPALYTAQRAWRELRDKDPTKLTKPMRCCLLSCLFRELLARMRNLGDDAENQGKLKQLGWLSTDLGAWHFIQWSQDQKRLIADAAMNPIAVEEAISLVSEIHDMVSEPGLVVRFHPTRPLATNMSGESVTCCLQVSVREPKAAVLYDKLSVLAGLACTQLIGMGLRKDRAGRSALAQNIAKSM